MMIPESVRQDRSSVPCFPGMRRLSGSTLYSFCACLELVVSLRSPTTLAFIHHAVWNGFRVPLHPVVS